jgi:hypothetical protein
LRLLFVDSDADYNDSASDIVFIMEFIAVLCLWASVSIMFERNTKEPAQGTKTIKPESASGRTEDANTRAKAGGRGKRTRTRTR